MRNTLLLLGALGVAAFVQTLVLRLLPGPSRGFDPFLVVAFFAAVGARSPAPALIAGSAAGLVRDALTGGRLGMHGFAYTVAGWLLHGLRQRFVLQTPVQLLLLFSLVAAVEQALLAGLEAAFVARPELPDPVAVLGVVVTTGLLGCALRSARERFGTWFLDRRERRRRRLGLETRP